MPEGPEVRRAADAVADVLVGARLTAVFFAFAHLKPFEKRLSARRVTAVETRGKAMLIRFDNELTLFSHNQLYGRWYVLPARERPVTARTLRVGLETATHGALLYSASNIAVLNPAELAKHPFLIRLGPDILDPALTAGKIVARLQSRAFGNRSLGALLLDQGFLAGTGNYLRSEILHFARLGAAFRPVDLREQTLRRLAKAILTVAVRSYRTGGVTNPPRRVAALKRRRLDIAQYRFAVFGRAGKPCYECGTRIRRRNVAGRRLYFCPLCQTASR